MFLYIWEYEVDPAALGAFERAYGPNGTWAQLFQRDSAYLGTELLRDSEDSFRFVTIDRWKSKEDRDRFREEVEIEFAALDAACEAFTISERHIGDFDLQEQR